MQGSLAGSFRHIGFEANVTEAAGVSYSVHRVDENNVQVTMGPNEAVEAFNGIGLRSDIATARFGRQDNLGGSTVRTATFDLSNPDGQVAYSHFVSTGEVAHETPGVSNVATIERVDYSSQTRLQLELGPLGADLAGPQNTGVFVKTTYPDGSCPYVTDLQYSGNVPLSPSASTRRATRSCPNAPTSSRSTATARVPAGWTAFSVPTKAPRRPPSPPT